MADLNITISNRLRVRAGTEGDEISLWGSMVWGEDFWWGKFDDALVITKGIANSLSLSQVLGKEVAKGITNQIGLASVIGRQLTRTYLNTLSLTSQIASSVITQGIWTEKAQDHETWADDVGANSAWTEQSVPNTNWDEA